MIKAQMEERETERLRQLELKHQEQEAMLRHIEKMKADDRSAEGREGMPYTQRLATVPKAFSAPPTSAAPPRAAALHEYYKCPVDSISTTQHLNRTSCPSSPTSVSDTIKVLGVVKCGIEVLCSLVTQLCPPKNCMVGLDRS